MEDRQRDMIYDVKQRTSKARGLMRFTAFVLYAAAFGGLAFLLFHAPDYLSSKGKTRSLVSNDQEVLDNVIIPSAQTTHQDELIAALLPTPSLTVEPTIKPTAIKAGCSAWSAITLADVGKQMCVQGTFTGQFDRSDGVKIMKFSDDAGAFQVWSSSRPFSWYLKETPTNCIIVEGWIQTSGVRPIIILGSTGKLNPCD